MPKYEVRQIYKTESIIEAKDRRELEKKLRLLGGKAEEVKSRREVRIIE